EELTYSFALQLTNVNHHQIYKLFHLALLEVFSKIGIECDYEKAGAGRESFKEAICFISPAKFELTKDGKKIVGSAQRILDGNILLQHGSIPLNDKYKLIAKYTTSEQNQYERYINIVNQKST